MHDLRRAALDQETDSFSAIAPHRLLNGEPREPVVRRGLRGFLDGHARE